MVKLMSIHQEDSKEIVKSNFVTSCLALRGLMPTPRTRLSHWTEDRRFMRLPITSSLFLTVGI